jgi:hypothetical protein
MAKIVDVGSIGPYFESLSDPRHTRNRKHLMVDIASQKPFHVASRLGSVTRFQPTPRTPAVSSPSTAKPVAGRTTRHGKRGQAPGLPKPIRRTQGHPGREPVPFFLRGVPRDRKPL